MSDNPNLLDEAPYGDYDYIEYLTDADWDADIEGRI